MKVSRSQTHVWLSFVFLVIIGIIVGYLAAGHILRWWYYIIALILVVLIIWGQMWVLLRQRKRWRIEAAQVLQNENVMVSLDGRYSRTIKIFYLVLAILMFADCVMFLLLPASTDGWGMKWFISIGHLLLVIGCGLAIWNYNKSFKVQVSSGKLYLRGMGSDVSRKIKTVEQVGKDCITIRFNFLYQLHVKGSQEQLDLFLQNLHKN